MKDERIISIYPNTIGFGFVILNEKGEIVDYGIATIRPIDNNKCLKRFVEIAEYYKPNTLLVENPDKSNKSKRVKKFINLTCDFARDKLKIYMYSKLEMRNTFEVFGAKNKFEISRKISEMYPELKTKLPDKRKLWEPENYYQGIFDALALVLTHLYFN